jgi:hypothetical protein
VFEVVFLVIVFGFASWSAFIVSEPLFASLLSLGDCVITSGPRKEDSRTRRRFLMIRQSRIEFASPTMNRNEPLTAAPTALGQQLPLAECTRHAPMIAPTLPTRSILLYTYVLIAIATFCDASIVTVGQSEIGRGN